MCVCMYMCIHVYVYVCTHVCVYVCMHVCVYLLTVVINLLFYYEIITYFCSQISFVFIK